MAILSSANGFTLNREQFKLWLKTRLADIGASSLSAAQGANLGLEGFAARDTMPTAAWLDDLANNLNLSQDAKDRTSAAVAVNLLYDSLLDYEIIQSPTNLKLELWPLVDNELLLLLMPAGQFGPQRVIGPQLILKGMELDFGKNLSPSQAVQELWQMANLLVVHSNSLLNTVALADVDSNYPPGEWRLDRGKLEDFVRDRLGTSAAVIPSIRAGVPLGEVNRAFLRAFNSLVKSEAIIPPPRIPLSAVSIWAIDDPQHEPLLLQLSLPTTDALRQARQLYLPLRFLNSWTRPMDWQSGIDEIYDAITVVLQSLSQLVPRHDLPSSPDSVKLPF